VYSSLNSRWIIGYIIAFTALSLTFSHLGIIGLGTVGLRAFSGALAGIINLNLYIVPLISTITASLSIVSEREQGTLEFHLSLPITRSELVIARALTTILAISFATVLGYGLSSWYMMLVLNEVDLTIFLKILAISLLMVFSFAGLGMLITTLTSSRFASLAASIALWIFLAMIYEMVLMALVIVFKLSPMELWFLIVLNPLEASRLLMVYSVDPHMTFLGELGSFIVREAGEWFVYPLIATPLAYGFAGLCTAVYLFRRGDL
jgi:ABC-type transport system involved in multi-copper enzyme maturation permease subunit